MPRKSPIAKIKDAADLAVGTVVDTGQKVVGQAVGQAAGAVGAVASKVPGRKKPKSAQQEPAPSTLRAVPQDAPARSHGDPVKPAAKKAPAKKLASAGPPEIPTPGETALAKKATTKKSPTKKAVAKKSPTKKTAAKKAPAKKAAAKKSPAKKTAAKKAPAKKAPTKKAPTSGQSPG